MKNSCYALLWLLGTVSGSLLVVQVATGQLPPAGGPAGWLSEGVADSCPVDSFLPPTQCITGPGTVGTGYDVQYDQAMGIATPAPAAEEGWGFVVLGYGPADDSATDGPACEVACPAHPATVAATAVIATVIADCDAETASPQNVTEAGRTGPANLLRGLARSLETCSSMLGYAAGQLECAAVAVDGQDECCDR